MPGLAVRWRGKPLVRDEETLSGLNSEAHHKIPHSCGLTEKPQLAWPGVVLWGLR